MITIHEMSHCLFFSPTHYENYVDKDGNLLGLNNVI